MLSVIIITCNEEKHIARCIQSVAWAKQIVVLDSGSKDNTVAIAKSLGAQVIETDWPGFGIQKQRALNFATEEWVLNLDADEFLAEQDKDRLIQAMNHKNIDAFKLPIMMIFQNQQMQYAGCETKHIRLFRRNKAQYSTDSVHEKVILQQGSKVAKCKSKIMHESYSNWFDALEKMNNYSSLSVKNRHRNASIFKAIIASNWMFIRNYFLKAWFLDGKAGLALAVYQSQGSWYRYLKQMTSL